MNKQVLEALLEYIDAKFDYEDARDMPLGGVHTDYLKRTRGRLADRLSHLVRLVEEQEDSK